MYVLAINVTYKIACLEYEICVHLLTASHQDSLQDWNFRSHIKKLDFSFPFCQFSILTYRI